VIVFDLCACGRRCRGPEEDIPWPGRDGSIAYWEEEGGGRRRRRRREEGVFYL